MTYERVGNNELVGLLGLSYDELVEYLLFFDNWETTLDEWESLGGG